jgi:hypothetical protein
LLVAIKIPAAFTGTVLKIKVANTDTDADYAYLYKDGADMQYAVAVSKVVKVTQDVICARYIKVESQTSEGGARVVTIKALRW